MRLREFAGTDDSDRLYVLMKTLAGRNKSTKSSNEVNWDALERVAHSAGISSDLDFDTFKAMYDADPRLQQLIPDFDVHGIKFSADEPAPRDSESSQEVVDQIAASAAPKMLGK